MPMVLKNEILDLAKTSPLFHNDEAKRKSWIEEIIPKLEEKELLKVKTVFMQAIAAEESFNEEKLQVLKKRAGNLYKVLMQAKIMIIEEKEEESKKEEKTIIETLENNLQKM